MKNYPILLVILISVLVFLSGNVVHAIYDYSLFQGNETGAKKLHQRNISSTTEFVCAAHVFNEQTGAVEVRSIEVDRYYKAMPLEGCRSVSKALKIQGSPVSIKYGEFVYHFYRGRLTGVTKN